MFENDSIFHLRDGRLPNPIDHGGGATEEFSNRAYICDWLAEVSNPFVAKDNPFDSSEIADVDQCDDLPSDEWLGHSSDSCACTTVELGKDFRRSCLHSRSRMQNRRHRPGYRRRRYNQQTRLPQRGNRHTCYKSRPSRLRLSVSAQSSDVAVRLFSPQTNVGPRLEVEEEAVGSERDDREREGKAAAPSAHGNRGRLDVWTAPAFQRPPAVQTRAFVALRALAIAEVDDDFLYQILVALKGAWTKPNESNTATIIASIPTHSCAGVIGITYDTLQDRMRDTFAKSSNAPPIRSVSTSRVALQDNVKSGSTSHGSTSTVEEGSTSPGRSHLNARGELGVQGLAALPSISPSYPPIAVSPQE